ncbi:hypothetical protein ACIQUQ_07430 [Streptomyces sp. NPDC101118]|uniref:hypothetical protein n=1 Tax=Streptomyces sp. NPDC101118 TaxID=3366109 RepID=UPI0038044D9A
MGWTVLYIAFGVVALWLLAEVLLQYKARLRWRVLAFAGFLGVVAGVLINSVLVIGVGATAFAVGQTLVTLSFRRGFVAGWALNAKREAAEPEPGRRGRRRGGSDAGRREEPALRVSDLEYGPEGDADPSEHPHGAPDAPGFTGASDEGAYDGSYDAPQDATAVYEPVPADSGYPYAGTGTDGAGTDYAGAGGYAAAGADYSGYYDPQQAAQDPYAGAGTGYAASFPGQDGYGGGYDYGAGEQQTYAAYSDPYIGTGGVTPQPDPSAYAAYDYGYGTGEQMYPAYPDPYTGQHQYATDTPPGGVWVPQQRDVEQPYPADQPPTYPYQGAPGEYEQYRY